MWLISCNVLPENHRVTADTAQVFDLAQTLRDGVLLCQLLNNLRPQTINLKEINLRPQMSQVDRSFHFCSAFKETYGCVVQGTANQERVQMSAARHYCDFKACHNNKAAVICQRSDHLCFWQMTEKCVVVCMQVFTQVGSCFSRDDCDHMRSLNTPPQKQSRIYNMLMHYVLFCEDACRQRIKEDFFKLQSRCMGAFIVFLPL